MYILFTAVLSAVLVFCVVYPLWYFATAASSLYTIIVISLALVFLIAAIIRKILRKYKTISDETGRKKYAKKLFFTVLSICTAFLTIFIPVRFVLSENRLIALAFFAAGTALFIVLARIRKRYSDV